MRKRRVVWSSSTDPALFGLPARRPGHLRQAIRTGVLLAVLGLTRLAGNLRWRSAVIGAGQLPWVHCFGADTGQWHHEALDALLAARDRAQRAPKCLRAYPLSEAAHADRRE